MYIFIVVIYVCDIIEFITFSIKFNAVLKHPAVHTPHL